MTRNTPEMLPYCVHCGRYKGVGKCKNPDCDKSNYINLEQSYENVNSCVICSNEGSSSCSRCGRVYCNRHDKGKRENHMIDFNQHIGECIECGAIVCEYCWILNKDGKIICLTHNERKIAQ